MTGAAGAYGGYVIHLAKSEGLTVIADASEKDEKLVASLGADIVVRRGDDVASRIRKHFPQGVDGLADGAVLNALVIPAVRDGGAFSPSAASGASRSGISTSRQPWCAPTRRSSRSSIGFGNKSRPAKSRFAWRRSIRRKGLPRPFGGWWYERAAGHPILILEDRPENRSAQANGAFRGADRDGRMTGMVELTPSSSCPRTTGIGGFR